ncbi:ADP-ribosylation factor family-domain-containing protein [Podospora aff. communis PSN243]|uniref:ADP-ribosylation factor family-domain-containing protein n=1 Tax=Podospora aff. communis PSN243 TaxID=3040156 RepID=A0AAV9G7Z8_9PEZI|nr:ADP-ribosylation factor family-domain-containing protein [Podospora aff. communis PSN243]
MKSILKRFFNKPLPNISIMGLDAGGKTTLLYKLRPSKVNQTIPTIGLNIEAAEIGALPHFKFVARVADVGGCGRFYSLVRYAMMDETVSALIWVVDAHDKDRLGESVEELATLLHGGLGKDENYAPGMPVVILANKIDLLPDCKVPETFRAEFEKLLKGRRFAYFETCFQDYTGLEEAFTWLKNEISPEAKPTPAPEKKPVEHVLSDMRSPAALSAKLETWLERAETDPTSADELVEQLEALDLPSWDHYTHLRLAYILLLKHGRRIGKDKIFDGFKSYIDKSGKVHGKSFHMTMTYFWVQMVHLGLAGMQDRNSHTLKADSKEEDDSGSLLEDDFAHFLAVNPYLVDGQLWADYYSKELLMSPEAKQGVQFPDIKKLPDVLVPRATVKREVEKWEVDSVTSTVL